MDSLTTRTNPSPDLVAYFAQIMVATPIARMHCQNAKLGSTQAAYIIADIFKQFGTQQFDLDSLRHNSEATRTAIQIATFVGIIHEQGEGLAFHTKHHDRLTALQEGTVPIIRTAVAQHLGTAGRQELVCTADSLRTTLGNYYRAVVFRRQLHALEKLPPIQGLWNGMIELRTVIPVSPQYFSPATADHDCNVLIGSSMQLVVRWGEFQLAKSAEVVSCTNGAIQISIMEPSFHSLTLRSLQKLLRSGLTLSRVRELIDEWARLNPRSAAIQTTSSGVKPFCENC